MGLYTVEEAAQQACRGEGERGSGDHAEDEQESGLALANHLAEHGIKATFEMVKIDGSSVGKVFEAYVKAKAIDLLVMGAYAHSPLRELVLRGVTRRTKEIAA